MVFYCFSLGPPFQRHSVFVLFPKRTNGPHAQHTRREKLFRIYCPFPLFQENTKKRTKTSLRGHPGPRNFLFKWSFAESRFSTGRNQKVVFKAEWPGLPLKAGRCEGWAPHHKSLFPLKLFSRLTATLVQYPFRWLSQMDAWLALFPCLVGGWRWVGWF